MRKQLSFIVESIVKPGALARLGALAPQMTAAIEAREPGVLGYGFFLSADGMRCTIEERYADSDAAIAHLEAMGDWFDRLFALVEPERTTVLGAPDEALRAKLAGFGATVMTPLARFLR